MCLIDLQETVVKKVFAWKLFCGKGNRPEGVCYCHYDYYKINQTYTAHNESTTGKGFQAFVRKVDAEITRKGWNSRSWINDHNKVHLRRVVLYDAQKGRINNMNYESEGMQGWSARAMKILPAKKRKKHV